MVCAFRIPHRSFHTHQDFQDDQEHNGGSFLLRLLVDSGIQNRAIFVVRDYDGTHIGSKRYDGMCDAVKAALAKAPKNAVTNNFDVIWEKDYTRGQRQFGNYQGSIRGGRGNAGQKHPQLNIVNSSQEYGTNGTGSAWDTPLQQRLLPDHVNENGTDT